MILNKFTKSALCQLWLLYSIRVFRAASIISISEQEILVEFQTKGFEFLYTLYYFFLMFYLLTCIRSNLIEKQILMLPLILLILCWLSILIYLFILFQYFEIFFRLSPLILFICIFYYIWSNSCCLQLLLVSVFCRCLSA